VHIDFGKILFPHAPPWQQRRKTRKLLTSAAAAFFIVICTAILIIAVSGHTPRLGGRGDGKSPLPLDLGK